MSAENLSGARTSSLPVVATADETSPPPSHRIGRYRVLAPLAKGGMAEVFVAQKDGSKDLVVLKRLLLDMEEHPTAGQRFHREAHFASFLFHPNIARVTDAGHEGGRFCFAMEYIAGKDVKTIVCALWERGLMMPYPLSVRVGVDVLSGLEHAHTARGADGAPMRLVHRDLSPRNIMISTDGEVKIIDFGLAHGEIDDFKTAPGIVLGTLRYVSPEQATAQPVDGRSDLYSISVVLHELLSGHYVVPSGSPREVLSAVVNDDLPPISDLNPQIPAAVSAVVARGLEKDPERRWRNATEYREALIDAARPLGSASAESVARFVAKLFPEEVERKRAFLEAARLSMETPPDLYLRTRTQPLPTAPVAPDPVIEPVRPTSLPDTEAAELGLDSATRTELRTELVRRADRRVPVELDPAAAEDWPAELPMVRTMPGHPAPPELAGSVRASSSSRRSPSFGLGESLPRRASSSGMAPLSTSGFVPIVRASSPVTPLLWAVLVVGGLLLVVSAVQIGRVLERRFPEPSPPAAPVESRPPLAIPVDLPPPAPAPPAPAPAPAASPERRREKRSAPLAPSAAVAAPPAAAPPSPSPDRPAGVGAALAERLAQLPAGDHAALVSLGREVKARASVLPPALRRQVDERVERAEQTADPSLLAEAIAVFSEAR